MTGKSIAIGVFVFGAGFITGWAARELVKRKNDELKSDSENETKNIKGNYISDLDDYKNISNTYASVTFNDFEKEIIEEANAEAEYPGEDDEEYEEEDDDEYYVQPNVEVNGKVRKNIWPYEIDEEEYLHENGYAKSTIEYYRNNVLIDEDGSEITNAGSIIGNGVLKNLMISKGTAYVRNESLEVDYEILFINETYESLDEWDD